LASQYIKKIKRKYGLLSEKLKMSKKELKKFNENMKKIENYKSFKK